MNHDAFEVMFPDDFDEWASMTEAKGRIPGVIVVADGRRFSLTFIDPVRLGQDVRSDLELHPHFWSETRRSVSRLGARNVRWPARRSSSSRTSFTLTTPRRSSPIGTRNIGSSAVCPSGTQNLATTGFFLLQGPTPDRLPLCRSRPSS